jgi:flagellar protein FliL
MSDVATGTATANAETPKKKGKLIPIIITVVVLAAAGGGYYYLQHSKAEAKTGEGEERTANASGKARAKNPADDEADPAEEEAPTAEEVAQKKKNDLDLRLPDDSAVKQIIELQPYIVNLADPNEARYLRLTVSLGIGSEEGQEKPSPLFTTRIRNAMLAVLTSRTSEEVLSNEGKAKLRRDLLRAARAASKEPRVEAIYITEFIVQL